jgi:hypothetical protein
MRLTHKQEVEIRLLSDTDLYHRAMAFAREHEAAAQHRTTNSQLQGLIEFSRSWGELERFVKHQKSKEQAYKTFYVALDASLAELHILAKRQFVPDGLTKRERREQADFFAGLLGREFVQHLTAEMMWKREVQSR